MLSVNNIMVDDNNDRALQYYKTSFPALLVACFERGDGMEFSVSPNFNYITESYDSSFSLFKTNDYANKLKFPVDVTHLYYQDRDAFWTAIWGPNSDMLILQYGSEIAVSYWLP